MQGFWLNWSEDQDTCVKYAKNSQISTRHCHAVFSRHSYSRFSNSFPVDSSSNHSHGHCATVCKLADLGGKGRKSVTLLSFSPSVKYLGYKILTCCDSRWNFWPSTTALCNQDQWTVNYIVRQPAAINSARNKPFLKWKFVQDSIICLFFSITSAWSL